MSTSMPLWCALAWRHPPCRCQKSCGGNLVPKADPTRISSKRTKRQHGPNDYIEIVTLKRFQENKVVQRIKPRHTCAKQKLSWHNVIPFETDPERATVGKLTSKRLLGS
eukprot:4230193-Amphidinium_carterae.1